MTGDRPLIPCRGAPFPVRNEGSVPDSMKQLLLDFTRAPEPTFANFVHGGNVEAAHALEAAARAPFPERVFYIWGESSAGKTHLLKAFVSAAGERARYARAGDL